MIARIWRGETTTAKADAYFDYMEETGLRDYRAADGNRGLFALRRRRGARTEFLLLTLWQSFEAIRRFAGPEPERAVYYPEDESYLLRLEPEVEHYEVVAWPSGAAAAPVDSPSGEGS